jgi:hypothetical protein
MERPYIPTSFHYSEIQKNDVRLSAQVAYVKENFDPSNTYVLTESQLWRPLMYYLKEYHVVNLEGFYTTDFPYQWEQRDAYEWDFLGKKVSDLRFYLPIGIDHLVFVENGKDRLVRRAKYIELAGNAHLSVLSVGEYRVLSYKFHQIYYESEK